MVCAYKQQNKQANNQTHKHTGKHPTHFHRPLSQQNLVVVVLRSPIHANEPSEYNGMLYRTSNRVLNNE